MAKDKKTEYMYEEDSLFPQKYKKLKKEFARCKKEKQEYLDGWQRSRAELQNFIKQKEIEVQDFKRFATSEIILKVLIFFDNLGFILDSAPKSVKGDPWLKGIASTRKQLEDMLMREGIEEISAEQGGEFEPARHEAVEAVESNEKSGLVAEVLQKGYTLNGKVIRPTRVKIAK